ncbi:16S rRNA (cytosine(967)-C(5))-methyltransferase RsmB [Tahibacter soli]|uniref:16S rRNA (cytosine(967)-C(5))-methyltransferase n=1 Tax=Tahibacter soli TaxID=2983605 RepID=A0A9X4BH02_9GAMM|nr:16S rRNA (cytosine(967)-C(5))-methyltransferase RsmB [Tahibacter soli]MDC8013515.1 16S rRNA (cytosine(967)-C(5))-methyltransferase RsmB [Tahibacter soli]
MSDARAFAAQALERIVRGGVSLRDAFAQFAPRLHDARDRALLSALLHDGARWWLRYDAAVGRLMDQPLRTREPALHALIVLGLVQIEVMGLPDYAAVAGSVDATRTLRRPKFAGLVNAVLRRWLRERDEIGAKLDADPMTACAHPRWLLDTLAADWPRDVEAILAANNAQAPLTLRANRRRTTRDALIARLAEGGCEAAAHAWLPDAIVLAQSTDVTRLPGYADGEFSVQDGAAQLAPQLLDLASGQRVLDACAAPGGKSAHILECADVELTALDRDPERVAAMRDTFSRLGVKPRVAVGDAGAPKAWSNGRRYDRILVDAPCTATGVLRRQPDIRLHRRGGDVAPVVAEQTRILDALWPLVEPGGRLVYATCSILRAENAAQIAAFLARHPDAAPLADFASEFGRPDGHGRQNLPGDGGMDGFFYAVLDKRA